MTAETRGLPSDAPPRIDPAYMDDPASRPNRRRQLFILLGVIGFCLIYGMAFAFLAPALIIIFVVPIAVLALMVIWALPTINKAPTVLLERLFFCFFVVLIMWPNYLALALPGLPWITASRITGLPTFLAFLVCMSLSRSFQATIIDTVKANKPLFVLLTTFVVIQFYSIALSSEKGQSIDKFIAAQTSWTGMLFVSCYVFQKPGRLQRWAAILWTMAVVAGLIAIWEYHKKQLPWVGHIPSFLKIEDPVVIRQLAGFTRAYTNIYRAQSTFATSLDFAEYLALTFPFVFHFLVQPYKFWIRGLALISIPYLVLICYITGSRIAIIGFLLSILLYVLSWGILDWIRNRGSFWGPSIVLGFPIGSAVLGVAVLAIHRLHTLVLGNGAVKNSNRGRLEQIKLGIPKIIKNPIGHGIGRGAETLNWTQEDGFLSIDNYYLLIALEYGVLGFIVFYAMIGYAIYICARCSLLNVREDKELSFVTPAGIALVNFFIIRSVFSNQNNIPIIYIMLGAISALALRLRNVQITPRVR